MKIGILSRNANLYSTKRLVEAAQQYGCEVKIIDHLKCDLLMEAGKPTIYYKGCELPAIDAIIPRIGASVTFYGAAVVRQFEMMNVTSSVLSQAIIRSRDKLRTLQILSKAGVGLPKTAFTNYTKDAQGVIDRVGGAPVIIKLLEGTQGLGVILAETNNSAVSILQSFNQIEERVIIQEFIKEANGTDIRVFVVNNKVVGAMKRESKMGEFRSNLHQGGKGKVVYLTPEEEATALKAAATLNLAVAGVDILPSERGPLVIEINSSPGLEGIEKATGIDIAAQIIDYLYHKTLEEQKMLLG